MAQDTKLSVHDNIWHFSVTDPQLHRKGFTVYKVTCKTFPIKSPETLTEVVCWKRYNDFKTLYKSLTALHKALHRRDPFPVFAKPKLFGRFDDSVIEERRLSAVELLNFVASQPHLYKSLVFKQFLEEGRIRTDSSKKGSLMTPRPSTLDIIASGSQTDGNPPPDLVPTKIPVNAHRDLKQGEARTPETVEGCEQAEGLGQAGQNKGSNNHFTEMAALEGTWNFPQVADNISLDSSTGDETVDTDEDSLLGSSLPDADLAFFDPLPHDSAVADLDESSGGIQRSNSWLLAGLNMCAEMESRDLEENDIGSDSATTPMGPDSSNNQEVPVMSPESTLTDTLATLPRTPERKQSNLSGSVGSASRKGSSSSSAATPGKSIDLEEFDPIRRMSESSETSKVECGKGDLDLSAEWQFRSSSFTSEVSTGSQSQEVGNVTAVLSQEKSVIGTLHRPASGTSSRSHSVGSDRSQDSEKNKSNRSTPSRTSRNLLKRFVTGSPGTRKARSNTEQSVSTMDLGGKEDYIYLAASQICMAQNSEANGEYEVAFAYYKSGVGILLQGVQGDTNKSRRDAVRRKTAQYLMKAEDLFNKHLAAENVDERRWGADSFLSPSLDLDPSFAFIRGSVKELRNFQVLGIIDTVILVRDKATDETFVIKSIPKSTKDTGRTQSILPTSCPYMVSLHKFYETDDAVFLLLQYASGGKLWTYIEDYLSSDKGNQADCGADLDVVKTNTESGNIYSGTKVENTGRFDQSETSDLKCAEKVADSDIKTNTKTSGVSESDKSYGASVGTVQCSENITVMRFSTLKTGNSDSDTTDTLTMNTSQYGSSSTEGETGRLQEFENKINLNNSDSREILEYSSMKQPLSRRFSSLSDDCAQVNEGDSSVISPTTILEEEQFQAILQEHRSNLEGFSINSFESEDTSRLSSSFREKIDSIPEDNECDSSKHLASRQISADEVFSQTRKEAFQLIDESRVRYASTDGVFSQHDPGKLSSTFNCDDMIQSSKELLKEVEKVLSETENRTGEDSSSISNDISQTDSSSTSVAKLSSKNSSDSTEEPSIYDMNRSTEEDTSDQTSNANSDKNLDSPILNQTELICNQDDTNAHVSKNAWAEDENLSAPNSIDNSDAREISNDSGKCVTGNEILGSRIQSQKSSSVFRQASTPVKLSINRMDSKDMTRSASFECDLKSPTRNRARTVSDLFERLDSTKVEQIRLPESSIKKWMAQLVTAVSRLHSLGIVCRDLKPNNILLGDGGQVFLTYFCHLGHGDHDLDWDAKEYLYAAPEVGSISGYDQSCDWWSIGALLYELVVGKSLSDCHPGGINSHTCLHVPTFVSNEARGLLEGLLRHNPNERLGSGIAGSEEIKAHPFFAGVDWHALEYS